MEASLKKEVFLFLWKIDLISFFGMVSDSEGRIPPGDYAALRFKVADDTLDAD